jgi:hypothetical protein
MTRRSSGCRTTARIAVRSAGTGGDCFMLSEGYPHIAAKARGPAILLRPPR